MPRKKKNTKKKKKKKKKKHKCVKVKRKVNCQKKKLAKQKHVQQTQIKSECKDECKTASNDASSNTNYTLSTRTCSSCKHKDAKLRCSGCKAVYYCNEDCQRNHWKVHKKECTSKCTSVNACPSLNRIVIVLKWYKTNHGSNSNDFMKSLMKYQAYLVNDYHHVLKMHLNAYHPDNFELIYKRLVDKESLFCDIQTCNVFKHHHRDTERENNDFDAPSIYIDCINSLHCYFLHSIDCGYRIIGDRNGNDNDLQCERNIIIAVRGNERFAHNKFVTQSKSYTQIDQHQGGDNDHDENEEFVSDFFCFGEQYCHYNCTVVNVENDDFDFTPKYDSIKEELTSNTIFPISISEYQNAYMKTTYLLKNSDHIKSLCRTSEFGGGWGIAERLVPNSPKNIGIDHVLSIVLYTDYDTLSREFSATWRKNRKNETLQEIATRHREFWFWGKTLVDTVHLYGTNINSIFRNILRRSSRSSPVKFYHGMPRLYFAAMAAHFNSPTSTTSRLEVAQLFARDNGIVVELQPENEHSNVTCFDCSLISRFANEDEKLFIQPHILSFAGKLKIISMSDASNGTNYAAVSKALAKLEHMMNGNELDNFLNQSQESVLIISELILNLIEAHGEDCIVMSGLLEKYQTNDNDEGIGMECEDDHDVRTMSETQLLRCLHSPNPTEAILSSKHILKDANESKYILEVFTKWRNSQRKIVVNMSYLEDGWPVRYPDKFRHCFVFPNTNGLLMFDVMNLVFSKVELIVCLRVGEITQRRLCIIFKTIEKINKFKFSKLSEIQLHGLRSPTAVKSMIEAYTAIFEELQWVLRIVVTTEYDGGDEYDVPTLVLFKNVHCV
eukprot:83403_1